MYGLDISKNMMDILNSEFEIKNFYTTFGLELFSS
jgi:hypothetical protein